MEHKYFCVVTVSNRQALQRLRDFEFDLFRATVKSSAADFRASIATPVPAPAPAYSIEGLLSLDEIGKLVDSGYPVAVEASAASRSRALNTMEFRDWLKAVEEG